MPPLDAEDSLSLADASQAAVLAKAELFKFEIGLVIHLCLDFQHCLYFYGAFGNFSPLLLLTLIFLSAFLTNACFTLLGNFKQTGKSLLLLWCTAIIIR